MELTGGKSLVPGTHLPLLVEETDESLLFSLCEVDDILNVKKFPVLSGV